MNLNKNNMVTNHYELQHPKHIISLASSSLLVCVDVNVWSATKQDKNISDEVTTMKNAEVGTGKFTKYLFANNPKHHKIVKLRQLIYNWLKKSTYRWNNSQDLLPTIDLEKFKNEYGLYEREFNLLVDDFINNYQNLVSDMAFKQGDMFDEKDYPDVNILRQKFNMQLYVAEVPSHDFRCQISQDIADDLKIQYQQQTDSIVHNIVDEQVYRIVDVMKSITHCCGYIESMDKEGKPIFKKRAIYNTTIERAKALINTIKNFKPIDSEQSIKLQNAVNNLEQIISGVSTELLRDSDSTREDVKKGIDNILSKFN